MTSHPDPTDPAVLDVHDFRLAGGMRRLNRSATAGADLGNTVITVPSGGPVELSILLESVIEGVLVTGTAAVTAVGECSRCLDRVALPLEFQFSELFLWDPPDPEVAAAEEEPLPEVVAGLIDLAPTLRDTIVLGLPLAPVCDESCQGLCSECGARLADVAADHGHDSRDPRWSALASLEVASDDEG